MDMNNNITPVNFGATFIKSVEIKKFNPKTNLYKPIKASVVKYDVYNKYDLKSMKTAVRDWNGQVFAENIVENAGEMRDSDYKKAQNQIYLLTEQNENFDRLKSSKILGMANMKQWFDSSDELAYLQTRPDSMHTFKRRPFKGVGKALIDTMKDMYKKIELTASYSAKQFYEKQDFKIIDPDYRRYRWDG